MDKVTERQFMTMGSGQKILHLLKQNGEQTNEQISDSLQMKKRNVDSMLYRLHKSGKIVRVGTGCYKLPE